MADSQPAPLPTPNATSTRSPAQPPVNPAVKPPAQSQVQPPVQPAAPPPIQPPFEDPEKPKPSGKNRAKDICKRWWPLFLLLATILLLIIVLPIVYVAYPKAARRAIHDSRLNVTYMSILEPTPEGIELTVVERLWSNSSHDPTLYPFNASLYTLDRSTNVPFASIQTNKVKAHNNASIVVGPKRIYITHPNEFADFVSMVARSEEFTYALRGSGELKQGALPKVHVDYDKNITMKGLNGLKSFSLASFRILPDNETQSDGTNALGNVFILNPTVMTIALGNVTLALSVNGTSIGTAALPNLVLSPGNNTIDMRAVIYKLVAAAIAMEREQTLLPVDVQGNTSTFQGRQIPYYNKMLSQMKQRVNIDVIDATSGQR